MAEAFHLADDILRQGIRLVTDMVFTTGKINLDFADLTMVLRESPSSDAVLGIGESENGSAEEAVRRVFELGPDELAMHAGVGEHAVTAGMDVLVCIGERSKAMLEGAKQAKKDAKAADMQLFWFASVEEFLEKKDEIFAQGDTILVKASHAMHFEKIVAALTQSQT